MVGAGARGTATAEREEPAYSDGVEVEERLVRLLETADDVSSSAWIARDEQATSWPVRYHLSPLRANLLRHLRLDGRRVLELGAGMGGMSRSLAERAAGFVGVEASARRLEGLRLRLRDLDHATALEGRLEELEPDEEGFDLVCLVGVLEYAALHVLAPPGVDPFVHLLQRAAQHLRPGGLLVLAIENRLGVKYWTGAPEDHVGRHFEGVAGYSSRAGVRTFSRGELRAVFSRAGLDALAEHLPFPDYKLPHDVLDARLLEHDPRLAVDMACFSPFVSHEAARVHLVPDYLALDGLASAGLFDEFANSFLLFAGRQGDVAASETLAQILDTDELAWHYAPSRAVPTCTVVQRRADGLWIDKQVDREHVDPRRLARSTRPKGAGDEAAAVWRRPEPTPPAPGEPLRLRLLRALYFDDSDDFLRELTAYLEWARRRFAIEGEPTADGPLLAGEALDAVVRNVSVDPDGAYHLFDLEWQALEPLPMSWFVLRNVLALSDDFVTTGRRLRWRTLGALYRDTCRMIGVEPRLEGDLVRERVLLGTVLGESSEALGARLVDLLQRTYDRRFEGLLGDIATGEAPEVAVLAQRIEHLEGATAALFESLGSQESTLRSLAEAVSSNGASLQAVHAALSRHDDDLGARVHERTRQLEAERAQRHAVELRLRELEAGRMASPVMRLRRAFGRLLRPLARRSLRLLRGRGSESSG